MIFDNLSFSDKLQISQQQSELQKMKVFFQPMTLPLHGNELSNPKQGKSEEFQALNTRHSTNQTPRQQFHDQILLRNSGLFKSRNHITILDPSTKREENLFKQQKDIEIERQTRGNQRLFKSLKSIPYLKGNEDRSRQRSGRRNKIFENREGQKVKMEKQVKPLVTIQYQNQSNSYGNGPSINSQNYFGNGKFGSQFRLQVNSHHESNQYKCAPRLSSHGFISGIREQSSRIVRVNSSRTPLGQQRNLSNSSLNKPTASKVTFSYANQNINSLGYQQTSQQLLKPPLVCQPIHTSFPYQTPSNNQIFIKSSQIHQNPIINKIKKPNPTHRKGTLIDQITYETTSKVDKMNSVDYHGSNHHQPYNSVSSKVSLGSNIKDSIVGGRSLAADKLRIGQSFSNIEEDNSNQRYFDDQQPQDLIFGQKISYKNIEIENQTQENAENWQETNAHNIFCDFQHSRRNEQQQSLQKEKKSSIFKSDPILHKIYQPQQILQKSTLTIKSQSKKLDINFPILLIAMASLLLLLQLLN